MKTLIIVAVLLVVTVTLGFTFKTPTAQQWEYRFAGSMTENKANELGAQGWELVTVDSKPMMGGGAIGNYVFKRPK